MGVVFQFIGEMMALGSAWGIFGAWASETSTAPAWMCFLLSLILERLGRISHLLEEHLTPDRPRTATELDDDFSELSSS